jgi:transposase-like protein
MKFHLVQYSKQPTVEEFEARTTMNGSPPDSPVQQSATINKLQIHPELLTMKQSEAARILGISPSMLSKRWREAMNGRKWPYRVHRKLQKEINSIVTLMDDNKNPPTTATTTTATTTILEPTLEPPLPESQDMVKRLKLVSMYKSVGSQ